MKFLIIDNYDSFVYNIAQRLGELGVTSDVVRNDKVTISDIEKSNYDAIIISDYGKGLITKELVEEVCSLAIEHDKVLTVDPKVEHFAYYRGVTAITPNKKEAENAIRNIKITQSNPRKLALNSDRLDSLSEVEKAGKQLLKFMGLDLLPREIRNS